MLLVVEPTARPAKPRHSQHSTGVLVVANDSPHNRSIVATLRHEGYDVAHVKEATNLFPWLHGGRERPAPEIVLIDAGWGAQKWQTFARAVRRFDRFVPVVLFSNPGDEQSLDACIELGVDVCLKMPTDMQQLRQAVRTLAPPLLDIAS